MDRDPDQQQGEGGTTSERFLTPALLRPVPEEHRFARTVVELVATGHREGAKRPIEGPDEDGVFPVRSLPMIGGDRPPVVVDANVLRNDVAYACRNDRRTVLVNAANAGAIRLYAASHVIDEVNEHMERWTQESDGVSREMFEERWRSEYLPLIRNVEDEELSPGMLSAEELTRVRKLQVADPDDVPSVILCLVVGGFFLSRDPAALRAVYGEAVDRAAHRDWVETLRAGGNAGQLGNLLFAAGAIPMAAVAGLIGASRWLLRKVPPLALAPIGLSLVPLARGRLTEKKSREKLWDGIAEIAAGLLYAYNLYQQADLDFRRTAATAPSWSELWEVEKPQMALKRACMHALARSRNGQLSASEVVDAVIALGGGEGANQVREILASSKSFLETHAGRWQVGAPAHYAFRA